MKKLRFTFFCIFLTIGLLKSQVNTYSPYSYFGVGELENSFHPTSISMGGVNSTLSEINYVNFKNPSSYSYLELTSFEIGNKTNFSKISNNSIDQNNFTTRLSHISLGFPLSKKIGFAVSLVPFSSVGYDITSTMEDSELGTVQHTYSGEGGFNQFLIGTSWAPVKNISIGLNCNWNFGTISKNTYVSTGNSPVYFGDEIIYSIGDVNYDIGFLYNYNINDYQLKIGSVFSPEKKISSSINRSQYTYSYSNNFINVLDTISIETNHLNSDLSLPLNYSIGISLENIDSWILALDYSYTNWAISDNILWDQTTYSLVDQNEFSFGAQIVPKKDDIYNYFNTVEYRFGLSYSSGYLDLANISHENIRSTNLEQISFSFGMGLPINNLASMFHLGLKYSTTISSDDPSMINQNYLSFNLAMTLNEKWFKKIKID
tara:strand:- start:16628 stop:17920 length:1293 start_codon:yes stop_codon:yes gene_type:complete